MSEWQQSILTAKARDLHAKVEAGMLNLNLTKIKLGSGTLTDTDNIDTMTDIKHTEQEIGISAKTPKDGGICSITGIITNAKVTAGFYVKELGLFAKDENDKEFLYAYMVDNRPDYQPSKDYGGAPVTASYSIDVAISSASKLYVNIDPVGLITTKILSGELERYIPKAGGEATGLISLASNLVANLSTSDNSGTLAPTSWVQAFVNDLSSKVELTTQDNGRFVCPSLGISGLIAQNGYISLGKLFGGLILQWGLIGKEGDIAEVTLPINANIQTIAGTDYNEYNDPCILSFYNITNNSFKCSGVRLDYKNQTKRIATFCRWIAIGKI